MIWLADLILVLHAVFIVFVVGGQILILAGWLRGWSWPRHRWFRLLHLLAIGVVMLQAWIGLACPLTTLEDFLRAPAAGTPIYEDGFIRYWLRELVFYTARAWVFTVIYTAFAGIVALTWLAYPPRRKL